MGRQKPRDRLLAIGKQSRRQRVRGKGRGSRRSKTHCAQAQDTMNVGILYHKREHKSKSENREGASETESRRWRRRGGSQRNKSCYV